MKPIDDKPPAFGPPQSVSPAASLAVVGLILSMAGVGISLIAFVLLWRYWQPPPAAVTQEPATVSSSLPSSDPTDEETFVSDDAAALLLAAAAEDYGTIEEMERFSTYRLFAGVKTFCVDGDGGRAVARWRSAFAELKRAQLVELASVYPARGSGGTFTWRLTKAGYAAADAIKRPR